MKRIFSLLLAGLFAFAPVAQADLRASSGAFGPIAATSGSVSTAVTGVTTLLAQSWVGATAPADVTEDTLATINVPSGLLGANGGLRIYTIWTVTNNADVKTLRIRFSGGAGTAFLAIAGASQAGFHGFTQIFNRGVTNSQIGNSEMASNASGSGVSTSGTVTGAIDTTAATTIVITGQKAVAGDALTLEGYAIEVIH